MFCVHSALSVSVYSGQTTQLCTVVYIRLCDDSDHRDGSSDHCYRLAAPTPGSDHTDSSHRFQSHSWARTYTKFSHLMNFNLCIKNVQVKWRALKNKYEKLYTCQSTTKDGIDHYNVHSFEAKGTYKKTAIYKGNSNLRRCGTHARISQKLKSWLRWRGTLTPC